MFACKVETEIKRENTCRLEINNTVLGFYLHVIVCIKKSNSESEVGTSKTAKTLNGV